MKPGWIDVLLEVNSEDVVTRYENMTTTEAKEAMAQELVEASRVGAEERCREVGGRLRTDSKPEWHIRRGSHILVGGDYLLVASRWQADVPNAFDINRVQYRG